MSTPNQLSDTPRTDAAWAKTFQDDEDQCRAGNAATDMRDECATLERELAALAAERDQLRAALALGQQNCDDAYDDLRAEHCTMRPKVEAASRTVRGAEWSVAGISRGAAEVVSSHDGAPAYGGTPSDAAVRAAIADLKAELNDAEAKGLVPRHAA